jgi:hypothetical protein
MFQIKDIKETTCILFDCNDNIIGTISSFLSLQDVRLQIRNLNIKNESKYSGYYLLWDHIKIKIYTDGSLESWPLGFFDIMDRQLDELLELK